MVKDRLLVMVQVLNVCAISLDNIPEALDSEIGASTLMSAHFHRQAPITLRFPLCGPFPTSIIVVLATTLRRFILEFSIVTISLCLGFFFEKLVLLINNKVVTVVLQESVFSVRQVEKLRLKFVKTLEHSHFPQYLVGNLIVPYRIKQINPIGIRKFIKIIE